MNTRKHRFTGFGLTLVLPVVLASCITIPLGLPLGAGPAEAAEAPDGKAAPSQTSAADNDRGPAGAPRDVRADSPFWPLDGWPIEELDTAANVDYLSDVERDVVLHLNMARSNPARYAREFIEPMLDYFNGSLYREPDSPANFAGIRTQEGTAAVVEAVRVLQRQDPLPLLYPSRGMSLGALDHARDQGQTGDVGHQGSDRSWPADRVNRHGRWQRTVGENIAYGPDSGREIVVQLIVDDGVPDRGHRVNIYSEDFGVVGVALGSHPRYGTVSVMTLAGDFREQR